MELLRPAGLLDLFLKRIWPNFFFHRFFGYVGVVIAIHGYDSGNDGYKDLAKDHNLVLETGGFAKVMVKQVEIQQTSNTLIKMINGYEGMIKCI